MDLALRKEQFSSAWLSAVAAVAGFALVKVHPDDDSIDYTLSARSGKGLERRPKLDVQLKATARQDVLSESELRLPLSLKNYDDLRATDLHVPRILAVVLLPADEDPWLEQTELSMSMRRCAYWASLRGLPAVPNSSSVTVAVPRTQLLTPDALAGIMARVSGGALP